MYKAVEYNLGNTQLHPEAEASTSFKFPLSRSCHAGQEP